MLIALSYRRCGRNLRAKLGTAINSLSANHAYLKMLYYLTCRFYVADCLVQGLGCAYWGRTFTATRKQFGQMPFSLKLVATSEHAFTGWTVYWRWWRIVVTYTFKQKPLQTFLPERQAPAYLPRVKTHSKALIAFYSVFYTRLLLNFTAICYVCIHLIVLPNFNHRMHACTWFATDKTFINEDVMLCYAATNDGSWTLLVITPLP